MNKTVKEILRVGISAAIGFWLVKYVDLSVILNILMFFVIYLIVSFVIEGIIKLVKRK